MHTGTAAHYTVCQTARLAGIATLNPMIGILGMSKSKERRKMKNKSPGHDTEAEQEAWIKQGAGLCATWHLSMSEPNLTSF
jgi:hypothetical protein